LPPADGQTADVVPNHVGFMVQGRPAKKSRGTRRVPVQEPAQAGCPGVQGWRSIADLRSPALASGLARADRRVTVVRDTCQCSLGLSARVHRRMGSRDFGTERHFRHSTCNRRQVRPGYRRPRVTHPGPRPARAPPRTCRVQGSGKLTSRRLLPREGCGTHGRRLLSRSDFSHR
jgi:hypothetical protein